MATKAKKGLCHPANRIGDLVGGNGGDKPAGVEEPGNGKKQSELARATDIVKGAIQIRIPRLEQTIARVPIVFDSELIVHAMGPDAIEAIRRNQEEDKDDRVGRRRPPRVPTREFEQARYIDNKGRDCVRSLALKSAMDEALRMLPGNQMGKIFPRPLFRAIVHVMGELTPIISPPPRMRVDPVRLADGKTSIAFRPGYFPCCALFEVRYNSGLLNADGLGNLVQLAGQCGMNEWRPLCGGNYGMFHLAEMDEYEAKVKEIVAVCADRKKAADAAAAKADEAGKKAAEAEAQMLATAEARAQEIIDAFKKGESDGLQIFQQRTK